jgi:hypothetical protein
MQPAQAERKCLGEEIECLIAELYIVELKVSIFRTEGHQIEASYP